MLLLLLVDGDDGGGGWDSPGGAFPLRRNVFCLVLYGLARNIYDNTDSIKSFVCHNEHHTHTHQPGTWHIIIINYLQKNVFVVLETTLDGNGKKGVYSRRISMYPTLLAHTTSHTHTHTQWLNASRKAEKIFMFVIWPTELKKKIATTSISPTI